MVWTLRAVGEQRREKSMWILMARREDVGWNLMDDGREGELHPGNDKS